MFNLDKPLKFLWILLLYVPIVYAECELPRHLKEANRMLSLLIKKVEKNFDVTCSASGGSMVHDIKEITITFWRYNKVSIEEARELEINITNFCLNIINNDEKARPYLTKFPFTHDNLHISLGFYDQNGDKLYDENIAFVNQRRNKVIYAKNDSMSLRFITIMEEPYEEAERLVREAEEKRTREERLNEKTTGCTTVKTYGFWNTIKQNILQMFGESKKKK